MKKEKGAFYFNSMFINIFQYIKEPSFQKVVARDTARPLDPISAVARTGRGPAGRSAPEPFRVIATDFNSYVNVSIAEGAPQRFAGRMAASTAPGLGVQPRMECWASR